VAMAAPRPAPSSTTRRALRIHAQAMRRDNGEKERLRALVDGAQLALVGTPADMSVRHIVNREAA
jgi:hypothetical protein